MHNSTSHGHLQRQREKAANDENGSTSATEEEVLPTLLRPVSTITRKTGCGNYFSFQSFGAEISSKPTEAADSIVHSSSSSHIETVRQLKQRNGCKVVSDQEYIKANNSSTCTGQRSSSRVPGTKYSSSVESSRPAKSVNNADRTFPKSNMKHKANIDQSKRRVQFPPEGHEVTEVFEVEVEKLGTRRAGKRHGSGETMDLTEELRHEAAQLRQILLDVLEDEHKQSPIQMAILKKLHSRALGEQRGEVKREVKKAAEEEAETCMQRGLKTASLKGGAAASSPFRTQQASLTQAYARSSSQSGPTAKSSAQRFKGPSSRGSAPYRPNVRTAAVTNLTSRWSNTDDLPITWPEPRRNSWLPEGTCVKLAQPTAHETGMQRWKRIAKDELLI